MIVVWFYDNGLNGVCWNGGMCGCKGLIDEGGVCSLLLICWLNMIDVGVMILYIVFVCDLFLIFCDLVGVFDVIEKWLDG